MRSELLRTDDDSELQLVTLLRRLCAKAEVPDAGGQGGARRHASPWTT